jgi:drug/metabolite transporter (DMT)-like permease
VRYFVFLLFALVIVRPARLRRAVFSRRPWLQGGRSLLGLIENAVFVLAFLYLPLADTHALAATSPLIVVGLAALWLGERAGWQRWLAVAGGFCGVLIIIRPGLATLDWPVLLPLGGAVLWAIYQVMTRLCARHDPPEATLLWTAAIGFLALCFVGPWQWQAPDAFAWTLILALALLGSLSHYALIRALDYAEAGVVQPFSYSLLVWAALLGWVVFADVPDAATILGAGIVVACGLWSWRQDRKRA